MRDKTVLPEKWLAYSNIGDRIAGTVFVAFKVPLDEKFNTSIREVDRFTPGHLMRSRPDLGLVIDLTNTLRYYNPEAIESYGAKHRKVACPGQMVPTANLVKRFCAIVDDFIHARIPGRPLIGVHCTHGVNRTGYMICSYMIRHLGIPAADAMLAFELGTLTEAPTPPDSRAGTSSARTIPSSLGTLSDLTAAPALTAALPPNPSASLTNTCPLTTATAPPLSPSEIEKIVLVHATPPLKKKKKATAAAAAAPGSKSKVKKRKKADAEPNKADPKSPQGPAPVRHSSRSSSTNAPTGASGSSPVKERRAPAAVATVAVAAPSPQAVEETVPRSPTAKRGRGRGRLRKRGRGGCCGSTKKDTIVGGWAWAWWFVTDVQRLSLEVMTLNPMCESVETAQGVPLTVTGVAQCKIMKADELLQTASEQFLGKSVKEIKSTVLQTLEGHLRAILGTLTVEEVYKDRDQFAALVREVAAPDVGRMGIEILSFTIKDVYDEVQYLASLGKAQTAAVKRDADIGVAQANRDAGIREAECEKAAMDVKYTTDTKIEDNARMFKLQKANFDREVNTAKAEAQLAYELQAAKIRQKIRNEEIQIEVVERRKQIEVEAQEVERKERELNATVRLPAEAESYKVQAIAEGKRTQTVEVARAEAERIKKIGSAEAYAIEGVGKAEAERMRMKAAVYKQYGEAAIMSLVLEALPKIAAEVSAPLAKTDEIVLLGGEDRGTAEVTRLVSQVPPAVQALTGVDLSKPQLSRSEQIKPRTVKSSPSTSKVLSKIPGAK